MDLTASIHSAVGEEGKCCGHLRDNMFQVLSVAGVGLGESNPFLTSSNRQKTLDCLKL